MRNLKRLKIALTFIVAFVLLLSLTGQTVATPMVSSSNNKKTYQLTVTVRVKNQGTSVARDVALDIPVMSAIDSPYQKLKSTLYSFKPLKQQKFSKGNRTAGFRIETLAAGEEYPLVQTYLLTAEPYSLDSKMKSDAVSRVGSLGTYLQNETKIESDSDQIRRLALKLVANEKPKTPEQIMAFAKAAYNYTTENLSYSLDAASVNKGALAALETGEGSCVEYASLFVALNRAVGIPARIVNGFAHATTTLNLPSEEVKKRRHQWAEFYHPQYGWVPVDPTLGNKADSRFGNLPAGYYIIQNYGDLPVSGSYKGGKLSVSFEYDIKQYQSTNK